MSILTLRGGRFFGNACRHIETSSFEVAELDATVPDREVPRHTHEVPHFVLVTRGIYVTEARNQDGLCPPGTLIYNPGGTTHRDRFRSTNGRFLSITPERTAWEILERASPMPVVLHNPLATLVPLQSLAGLLMREDADYEALVLELIGTTARPHDSERCVPSWLGRAKELLDDCGGQDVTIAVVARAAGVHPVSLARGFRKHFGCSPGEYQRRARLARLRGVLAGGDTSLADVALQCGFSDQSQMTRAFTGVFGVPPGQFRRLGFQNDKNLERAGATLDGRR